MDSVKEGIAVLFTLLVVNLLYHRYHTLNQATQTTTSLNQATQTTTSNSSNFGCVSTECVTLSNTLIQWINTSISPCDDFYEFNCAGWKRDNEIPAGQSSWDTLSILDQKNSLLLRDLFESNETLNNSDPTVVKAKIFYDSCMDITTIDDLGNIPLLDFMNQFNWGIFDDENENPLLTKQEDYDALATLLVALANNNINFFFDLGVTTDDKNSTRQIVAVSQSGLFLPREYYLPESNQTEVLGRYLTILAQSFNLTGNYSVEESEMIAVNILLLEIAMAQISLPLEDFRDPSAIYNNMTVSQFAALNPLLSLEKFLTLYFSDVSNISYLDDKLVVQTPQYFQNLTTVLGQTNKTTIIYYLQSRVLLDLSSFLSQDFRDASLELEKLTNENVTADDTNRWQTCLDQTDGVLGFAVGKIFVDKAFHGESKNIALTMIQSIIDSFKNNLIDVDWMDNTTRQLVREKADAMEFRVGYPDWIQNQTLLSQYYENLTVSSQQYFQNIINFQVDLRLKDKAEIFKPVDRTKWYVTPKTVNAYYSPEGNQLVITAGILQPPFFSQNYPLAYNYGAMGYIMGHEMTHGFDDEGSQYDKDGNLRSSLWSPIVRQRFLNKTQCIEDQYSNYSVVIDDQGTTDKINGQLTLGENIADNGGVKESYDAMRAALLALQANSPNNETTLPLPGLNYTHEQLFFIGFSQIWCNNILPSAAYLALQTDPHSPGQYRTNGVIVNNKQFGSVFQCEVGTPMNPQEKCEVW